MKKRTAILILALLTISCFGAGSLPRLAIAAETAIMEDPRISVSGGGLALTNDGAVWAWGSREQGWDWYTPRLVDGLKDFKAVATGNTHYLGLKADGTVWGWNHNYSGQLGDGTTNYKDLPVQATGLTDVVAISGGAYRTVALKSDGTVWFYGDNVGSGFVSDSQEYRLSIPSQVKGLTDVVSISAGGSHVLAVKRDGTVWALGSNSSGQLGVETFLSKTPMQVKGLTNVRMLSAGGMHSVALKHDGTVWAWGYNWHGQLGNGTKVNLNLPTQVRGLTDIIAISAGGDTTLALKSDGTVWGMGSNEKGQLGAEIAVDCLKPTQIQGIADAVAVAAGNTSISVLLKDGSVWSMGSNMFGQLGVGGAVESSNVPVKTLVELGPQPDRPIIITPPQAIEPTEPVTPTEPSQPTPVTPAKPVAVAKPIKSNVLINGQRVAFEAYNIDGFTYFKLRDLAAALNGSGDQFAVTWEGSRNAINLLTGQPYKVAGGELVSSGNTSEKTAKLSTSAIYLNGEQVPLTAYNIGGNNYFKLRDVGTAIGFGVAWNSGANSIEITAE